MKKVKEETATFDLNLEVIEVMALGEEAEKTICSICAGKKDPNAWVCPNCRQSYGYRAVEVVRSEVNRIKNRLEPTLFSQIFEVAKTLLQNSQDVEEKAVIEAIRSQYQEETGVELPFGGVRNAVLAAQKHLAKTRAKDEEKARTEAERQKRQAEKFERLLSHLREHAFPPDKKVIVIHDKMEIEGEHFSAKMVAAACHQIQNERSTVMAVELQKLLKGSFKAPATKSTGKTAKKRMKASLVKQGKK